MIKVETWRLIAFQLYHFKIFIAFQLRNSRNAINRFIFGVIRRIMQWLKAWSPHSRVAVPCQRMAIHGGPNRYPMNVSINGMVVLADCHVIMLVAKIGGILKRARLILFGRIFSIDGAITIRGIFGIAILIWQLDIGVYIVYPNDIGRFIARQREYRSRYRAHNRSIRTGLSGRPRQTAVSELDLPIWDSLNPVKYKVGINLIDSGGRTVILKLVVITPSTTKHHPHQRSRDHASYYQKNNYNY